MDGAVEQTHKKHDDDDDGDDEDAVCKNTNCIPPFFTSKEALRYVLCAPSDDGRIASEAPSQQSRLAAQLLD